MNPVYDPPHKVAAWLARRRTGMYSSDAAAACGVSPWSTPLEVWLSKVEPLADRRPTPAMVAGHALEPAVARLYELRFPGIALATPSGAVVHPDRPWMGATIDRVSDDGRIVELKTASAHAADYWGEDGTDEVPEQYLLQATHQMEVVGHDDCDLAVLIGGQDFRCYRVKRCAELVARMVEVEEELWERVRTRRPPEPDWTHPSTPELVRQLHRHNLEESEAELAAELGQYADAYETFGKTIAGLKEERDACKARLMHALGGATAGRLPDGRLVTAREIERAGYAVDPCRYVDFRIRAPKGQKGKRP